MAEEITQLSDRGSVTLPAAVRRKLGLVGGDVFSVGISGRSVVLTPAVVTPVELYTTERLEEFERNSELTPEELAGVRKAWRTDDYSGE